MTTFQGAYTALITPFVADGSKVDFDRLAQNLEQQAAGGVSGVVPCGTTGESPTLSDQEHRALVEKVVELAKPRGLTVIAGAGSNDTNYAIHLHRFSHAVGADAALHVTPYYNKPSQEGLYQHFMAIADSCDLPIVLYNIPGRTTVALTGDTIHRLSAHPNIRAIKEATGSLDLASEINLRTDLQLLSGDDSLTLPIASVGGVGVISVVSNLVPERVAALCEAFLNNDWPAAQEFHRELFALSRGLLGLAVNPVPIKTALALLGRDTGTVRLPLCSPDDDVRQSIKKLLAAGNLQSAKVPV